MDRNTKSEVAPRGVPPSRKTLGWVLGWGLVLAVIAWFVWGDTVGRQLRAAMKDREAYCRKEKLGPFLDKADPGYKQKQVQTDCDLLQIKPLDPLATEEGRYAHSFKLPPPHDQPKDVYRWWMTGEGYFKALCEAEAGEWIFRTVGNVESVVQLRSFPKYSASGLSIMIVSEDISDNRFYEGSAGLLTSLPRYSFVEALDKRPNPDTPSKTFIKLVLIERQTDTRTYREATEAGRYSEARSRFGLIQRGIDRKNAIEHGIRGAELLVVDRQTLEVLGFSRRFRRYTIDRPHENSMSAQSCPGEKAESQFVKAVLRPNQLSKEEN